MDYPYYISYQRGFGFPFGDREDIEFDGSSDMFIGFHNTPNCWKKGIICFNLGSDILEFLDEEIGAPRISLKDGTYIIKYPLPFGEKVLPVDSNEWFFKGDGLQKIFEFEKLGKINRNYRSNIQEISCEKGYIKIEDGICSGEGFKGFDICKATFPISKLLEGSFKYKLTS